ncbi:unnamed protein product [Penicillium olsonii]|nr:unnamed protein product [Penicillium olsonii]CAG7932298.1 unnamed protein product [Penicillium olsonii]
MKFSTTLIALVAAGLAQAQLPDVPECSLSCFVSALSSDGCSELLDFKCHCQKTELVSSITPCVKKACEVPDQISVSNAVVAQCSSAGHPISVPPVETTGASSATSTGAGSSSSAPAETSATATATPTATASESSSAAESSAAESTSAETTAVGSTAVGSSGAATSTPLGTKTGSASASASSPAYTGAAANVKGNLAGVAAVVAAAAYVL